MKVTYAPLSDFGWHDGDFELDEGVGIVERYGGDFREQYSEYLDDWWSLQTDDAFYCLRVEEQNGLDLRPSAIVQLFLFALWLVKRSPAHVKVKFFEEDGRPYPRSPFSVHLDRFQWNSLDGRSRLGSCDLDEAKRLLGHLAKIEAEQGRLRFALALSLRGCESYHWHVGAVLHISALEALLTCSKEPGITQRLARSYACLVAEDSDERSLEYEAFKRVYNFRSDLLHGRIHQYGSDDRNLRLSQEVDTVVGKLWRKVLGDDTVKAELGKDDQGRQAYLEPMIKPFDLNRTRQRQQGA